MSMFILPGLLCNLSMFSATMAAFPGSGGVDDFYGRETTLAGMADHALKQAPDRFVLLGHSMGARIALEIMRRVPERVSALILADTGIHPARPGPASARSVTPCVILAAIRALRRWSTPGCRRC